MPNPKEELLKAARTGKQDLIIKWLNRGADIDDTDEYGQTCLMQCCLQDSVETLDLLIRMGAKIHTRNHFGKTALHYAASSGSLQCVKRLLDLGARIDEKDDEGFSALLRAVVNRHLKCVVILVNRGAGVNEANNLGSTALALAAEHGYTEIVRVLLEAGANIHATGISNGDSSLMLAAFNGHIDLVRILLLKGGRINEANKDGDTALLLAAYEGHQECVLTLLEYGADKNHKNATGKTALMDAARHGHLETVETLLEFKVSTDEKDVHGKTALDCARENGHKAIEDILVPLTKTKTPGQSSARLACNSTSDAVPAPAEQTVVGIASVDTRNVRSALLPPPVPTTHTLLSPRQAMQQLASSPKETIKSPAENNGSGSRQDGKENCSSLLNIERANQVPVLSKSRGPTLASVLPSKSAVGACFSPLRSSDQCASKRSSDSMLSMDEPETKRRTSSSRKRLEIGATWKKNYAELIDLLECQELSIKQASKLAARLLHLDFAVVEPVMIKADMDDSKTVDLTEFYFAMRDLLDMVSEQKSAKG